MKTMILFVVWSMLVSLFTSVFIYYFGLPVVEMSRRENKCVRVVNADGSPSVFSCDKLPENFVTIKVK